MGGPGGAAPAASVDTTSTTAAPATTPSPSPNYLNAMTATGGTPQTAKTDGSFQSPLQVELVSTTNGCSAIASDPDG